MNQTEKALVVSLTALVVLGVAYRRRTRTLIELNTEYKKLHTWGKLAQRVMRETMEKNPGLDLHLSEDLLVDLEFYSIMDNQKMF